MRRCFIHIGTHNTGTTSIQHLLDRNSSTLLRMGYLYPQAGRPQALPGQHNLAWEISGDRRFQNDYGTIDDLLREVKDRSDDVILSSEDFECALYNGHKFSDFVSLLHSCGFLVTVILYVRNQIDYLPRIYLTHLHFDLSLAFAEALRCTLDVGQFRWREWIVNFDYCDVLTRIGKTPSVNIIVRSYDQARTSMCSDFLSNFNLTLRDLEVEGELFEHASLLLRDYLLMFLRNRRGGTLLENDESAVNSVISPGARNIRLSPAVRVELFQRFSDSNRKLFTEYGIPQPGLKDYEAQHDPDLSYVDQLFVENIEARFLGAAQGKELLGI